MVTASDYYAMLCYAMLRYAMLCYARLRYATPCLCLFTMTHSHDASPKGIPLNLHHAQNLCAHKRRVLEALPPSMPLSGSSSRGTRPTQVQINAGDRQPLWPTVAMTRIDCPVHARVVRCVPVLFGARTGGAARQPGSAQKEAAAAEAEKPAPNAYSGASGRSTR